MTTLLPETSRFVQRYDYQVSFDSNSMKHLAPTIV
jgi:hypothetical protein